MGRLPRTEILHDHAFLHVISRSFEGKWVFQDHEDFEQFKRLLQQAKKSHQFFIHHYCLMNTHFHLALSISSSFPFIQGMKEIKVGYSKYFNKKYKRTGPLWRDRFKSLLIENEGYLYACGLYIENNPVNAGMVEKAEDWPYSSSVYYLLTKEDSLIDSYDQKSAPEDVNINDERFFTKGRGIGSELFKLQLEEKSLPVP